jgi:pyruvate formate lyase activating enzyme
MHEAFMSAVMEVLDRMTVVGKLYEKLPDYAVRCHACAHHCLIQEGKRGICRVRFNQAGELKVPWGYVAGLASDPIEKKPFFHLLPGNDALTFGMLGCNFHCQFCQNWLSSQVLHEPESDSSVNYIQKISPEQIIHYAQRSGSSIIASSYNEPLITTEWAVDIFKLAKEINLPCVYVSNGYANPEVLEYLRPYLVGYKIDLKTMQDSHYRSLGGKLDVVLDTIRLAHEMGLWVEVVTLVIPGFNDSNEELWDAARFIASVSRDIPWHVTAFHPDFKLDDIPPTSVNSLKTAAEIGQEAGLHYVYAGNLPGRVESLEHTCCPTCNTVLIRRMGYMILDYRITAQGNCPNCSTKIAGIWSEHPDQVRIGGPGSPRWL